MASTAWVALWTKLIDTTASVSTRSKRRRMIHANPSRASESREAEPVFPGGMYVFTWPEALYLRDRATNPEDIVKLAASPKNGRKFAMLNKRLPRVGPRK